ncbi:cyclin-A2-4 [Citrus sinensis]|uniref:Cyclin-A2-4 n=1 Tax=Citrus sinensis TaxID=2711 RepID=A0ACB8JAM0_CITSI|nr:cyclin-A2-4 [Citrus sinensis]
MKKQSSIAANVGDSTGIMTRSRAATLASQSSGFVASSRAPSVQTRKRVLRENPKKAASDENNIIVTENPCRQHKRRAVLQDVTNVCCENSYRSFFHAAKIQPKNSKQAKNGQAQISKLAPSVSVKVLHVQANSKTRINKGTVKAGHKPVELSTSLGADMTVQLGSINECTRGNQRPSELQICTKKVEKDNFSGKLMTSCYPDHVDIDSDHTDPQLCSLYAADIYSNLQVAELNRRPFPNFMETVQRDITQAMRGILVDWLVEVSEEYKLVPDTLYMTVYLIDWFLCQNYIERQRLQLLGITCMLIASKYEEICAPRVEEFCFITDNTYSREESIFDCAPEKSYVTGIKDGESGAKMFGLSIIRTNNKNLSESPSLELEYLANFLAELSLVDYGFLKFIPSIIAASAVFLARWTMDQSSHPWNATLEHYTSYKASDLKVSAFALQDLQLNTNGCPLNAIRMKYRQEKVTSINDTQGSDAF